MAIIGMYCRNVGNLAWSDPTNVYHLLYNIGRIKPPIPSLAEYRGTSVPSAAVDNGLLTTAHDGRIIRISENQKIGGFHAYGPHS